MPNSPVEKLISNFPYKTELNLDGIIQYWRERAISGNKYDKLIAKEIVKDYESKQHLHGVIKSEDVGPNDKDFIQELSQPFHTERSSNELFAASEPFSMNVIYSTSGYMEAMQNIDLSDLALTQEMLSNMQTFKVIAAGRVILKKFYLPDLGELVTPFAMRVKHAEKNYTKFYKIEFHSEFVDVKAKTPVRKLSSSQINELFEAAEDTQKWLELLPPEEFKISGLIFLRFIDVTEQQIISNLKDDLLQKDSVISVKVLNDIAEKLSSLSELCSLKVGIVPFEPGNEMLARFGQNMWKGLVVNRDSSITCSDVADSFYSDMFKAKQSIIFKDIANKPESKVKKVLLEAGIRSLFLAPLLADGQFMGYLEIGSADPDGLNGFSAASFERQLPLFTMAVSRFLEGMDDRVQSIVKENCTAIHPSVEWSFSKAAYDYLEQKERGATAEMSPIVFENVFPLYGLSDVRNSSKTRNDSIQRDLENQLNLAKKTFKKVNKELGLLIIDELVYKIDKQLKKVKKGIQSGDELSFREFVNSELNIVLRDLDLQDSQSLKARKEYFSKLDSELGVVYKARRDFEESMNFLNERISKYLDDEQVSAQRMYPHYYERFKTDGVDYNIYIGASINPSKNFSELYLRNLRLWQLKSMCGVTVLASQLKLQMKVPLDTAQLILAYSSPMSVQFRYDEKKFDVNGAYNIRYEIIKKRIDKAGILGTKERLTQPGKIAIVYSHLREKEEYERYIGFLQNENLLSEEVEELKLERLPGAEGLKALRVTVKLDQNIDQVNIEELMELVK